MFPKKLGCYPDEEWKQIEGAIDKSLNPLQEAAVPRTPGIEFEGNFKEELA